jgi:hypothetical protein
MGALCLYRDEHLICSGIDSQIDVHTTLHISFLIYLPLIHPPTVPTQHRPLSLLLPCNKVPRATLLTKQTVSNNISTLATEPWHQTIGERTSGHNIPNFIHQSRAALCFPDYLKMLPDPRMRRKAHRRSAFDSPVCSPR